MERFDVVIAGAGPAGVATALALRARGVERVCLLDRARFPRDKPCGGGLTGHAVDAMRALDLELRVPFAEAGRALVRDGAVRREVALPRPVAVIDRRDFDASLVDQARERGVTVRLCEALVDYAVGAGGVEVKTARGALACEVLVGADGAGSAVRKRVARGGRRLAAPPIRLFRGFVPAPGHPPDLMVYDFSAMARGLRGYVWIFPAPGGRVNVGVMHAESAGSGKTGAALVELLAEELAEHGIELGDELRGWPAWGYRPGTRISAPRVLCVGDAAGIDALTGEGISVGMEQGVVAGGAIAEALAARDFELSDYRRRVRRATVGRELALDRWLAWLLYRDGFRPWLDLVLHDPAVLDLYAARVAGGLVLADQKLRLFGALGRMLVAPPRSSSTG